METKRRPIKITEPEETNKPEVFEKLFAHYDAQIKLLNDRRISRQSIVQAGSTDSETIQNLLTGLNNLINALNNSDLTEE